MAGQWLCTGSGVPPAVGAPRGQAGWPQRGGGFHARQPGGSPPLMNPPLCPKMLALETSPEDAEPRESAVHCYARLSSAVWK